MTARGRWRRSVTIRQEEDCRCDQCGARGRCKLVRIDETPLVGLCAACWEDLIEAHREAFSP
jgi:hypothetical protein